MTRRRVLVVRLNDEELAELRKDADVLGHRNLSEYARSLFCAARRRVRQERYSEPDADVSELLAVPVLEKESDRA